MGWKAIRDHYRIEHIVQVCEGKILIGSPYISSLLVVKPDGAVVWGELGPSSNDALARYKREMDADPAKLRDLLAAPDTFSASITVYTYDGAEIIEKQCEVVGWPNCTHEGEMMYENTHFADRASAVKCATDNARARVEWLTESVADTERDLAKKRGWLDEARSALTVLEAANG